MEIFVLLLIGTWRESTFNYVDKIKIYFILRAQNPASTIFCLPVRTRWWYVTLHAPIVSCSPSNELRVKLKVLEKKELLQIFDLAFFVFLTLTMLRADYEIGVEKTTVWFHDEVLFSVGWASPTDNGHHVRHPLSSAAFSNFDHCQRNVKRQNAQPQVKLMPSTHWFLIEINSFNNNPIAHATNSISWPVGVRVIFMVELLHNKRTNEETIFRLMIGKNHNFLFANYDNKSAQLNFLQFLHRRARLSNMYELKLASADWFMRNMFLLAHVRNK